MKRNDRSQTKRLFLPVGIVLTGFLLATGSLASVAERILDEAQQLLDRGAPEQALAKLDNALRRGKPNARALFLRSTARFMVGDHEIGVIDLREALKLDPSLRQGWLNLAAAEMAFERYDAAYQALSEAKKLDPAAPDNELNLGAVLLFLQRRDEAEAHFSRYLALNPGRGESALQVASNYALIGAIDPMIRYLEQAFAADERLRLRVRGDAKFSFFHLDAFLQLMTTDTYQPPTGAHQVQAAFPVRYATGDRQLIDAVTDALRDQKMAFDPTIEATESWALIWGDLRVKVSNQASGSGVVALSAPADRFTADEWHRRSQALFRSIQERLKTAEAARNMRSRDAGTGS